MEEAILAGADYVLVVGRIPEVHSDACFIEPISLEQLKQIPERAKVIWNSRNLDTGGMKTESFDEARAIWKGWLCQASNIRSVADIRKGANAVLVGTHLKEFVESSHDVSYR